MRPHDPGPHRGSSGSEREEWTEGDSGSPGGGIFVRGSTGFCSYARNYNKVSIRALQCLIKYHI